MIREICRYRVFSRRSIAYFLCLVLFASVLSCQETSEPATISVEEFLSVSEGDGPCWLDIRPGAATSDEAISDSKMSPKVKI